MHCDVFVGHVLTKLLFTNMVGIKRQNIKGGYKKYQQSDGAI